LPRWLTPEYGKLKIMEELEENLLEGLDDESRAYDLDLAMAEILPLLNIPWEEVTNV